MSFYTNTKKEVFNFDKDVNSKIDGDRSKVKDSDRTIKQLNQKYMLLSEDDKNDVPVISTPLTKSTPMPRPGLPDFDGSSASIDNTVANPDILNNKTVTCSDQAQLPAEYNKLCDSDDNPYLEDCNKFTLKKELIEEACLKEEKINKEDFSPYPDLNDPKFNLKIATKKEFNENRYDGEILDMSIEERAEILSNADFQLSPHQLFVKNFLSSDTPYNSLLLFHGLGTGKTCSAIGVSEDMREYLTEKGNPTNIKILIVASLPVLNNFRSSIFDANKLTLENGFWTSNTCLGNKLLNEINPLRVQNLRKNDVEIKINKIIDKNYEFITYSQLADKIKGLLTEKEEIEMTRPDVIKVKLSERTTRRIKDIFDETLLIIDEVHNINNMEDIEPDFVNNNPTAITEDTTQGEEEREVPFLEMVPKKSVLNLSNYLEMIVKTSKNMKLLFLSATPMYDSFREIIWLLNIMNTNDKRARIAVNQVFDKSGNFINGGKELLTRKVRGYISVVRGENPYTFPYRIYPSDFDLSNTFSADGYQYPTKTWDGNLLPERERERIISLYLSKIGSCGQGETEDCMNCQSCCYKKATKNLSELTSLTITMLLEMLIIVYPPEGNDLNIKELTGMDGFNRIMRYDKSTHTFKYADKHAGFFHPSKIGKYSAKIKTVLEKMNNSEGVILIYSDKIFSGLLPMALALEESGFCRYENNNLLHGTKQTSMSYVMITGNPTLSPDNKKDIETVTDVKNKNGEQVKVILISKAGAEGIDFKFIRQVHVLDPWFNLNRTEQVIGRAVRSFGHKDLAFAERNVQIFMHATMLEDLQTESFDLFVYRIAEDKAKKMGLITRLLKETAVDCIINHSQTNFTQENIYDKLKENGTVRQHLSTGQIINNFLVGDAPFSSACDYMEKCHYNCSLPVKVEDITELDEDTYNEKFIKANFDIILSEIKSLMRSGFFYKKDTIIEKLKKYPRIQIFAALSHLIDDVTEELLDKYGKPGHLINIGDYYLFQPTELNNKRISLYERMTPIDEKFQMIRFNV